MSQDGKDLGTLSIGNTRATLVVWDAAGRPKEAGAGFTTSIRGVRENLAWLRRSHPEADLVCCSVVPALKKVVAAEARKRGRRVRFFRGDLRPEIDIVPEPPEQVGDDRIAAALGALALDPAVPWIVADAGTALTCSVVTPSKGGRPPRFEGGLIMPGAALSLKALAAGTAQLPRLDPASIGDGEDFTFLGRSTAEALRCGVLLAQVASLLAMIEGQMRALGGRAKVVLTGGGAPALRDHFRALSQPLPFHIEYRPHLVHLGLRAAWLKAGVRGGGTATAQSCRSEIKS
jgi:type III pantothenate kinase